MKDLVKAKALYSKYLGTEPYIDSPYYVGYKAGDMEIGLDPNSQVGPIAYIDLADIKATLDEMLTAGAEMVKEPTNVGGGLQIAQVKDSAGNVVGVRQSA